MTTHSKTLECTHSALDLFEPQPLQTSVEQGEWVEYRPLTTIDEGSPIEFFIRGGDEYLDLSNSYLRIKLKVTKPNGGSMVDDVDDKRVVPTNLLLHSLFSEVDVHLNSTQLNSPSGAYPYLAYLQTLLTYSTTVKKTQMTAAMFYKDTPDHFHDLDGEDNSGMIKRKRHITNSNEVELIGRIHADIFHQPKYLLSHLDLHIKLNRNKDSFLLLTPKGDDDNRHKEYKVEVLEGGLFIRKIKISPIVSLSHAKVLEKNNAIYPITKNVLRVFHASTGSYSFQEDNLFLDRIPNKIVVAMVRSEGFNGSYGLNPFDFLHLNLNFLSLYHQGQQIPSKGLQPNFQEGCFTREYMTLFNATNTAWQNESCGLNMKDYSGGYTLYCFDLTPTLTVPSAVLEVQKAGPIHLEAPFATPLQFPVNVLVYGQFDAHIEITKTREVVII